MRGFVRCRTDGRGAAGQDAPMKTQTSVAQIPTPFATIYSQWLDSFRAMLPGQSSAALNAPMPIEVQVPAKRKTAGESRIVKPAPAAKKKATLKARPAGKTKKAVSAPARGRRKLIGKKKK